MPAIEGAKTAVYVLRINRIIFTAGGSADGLSGSDRLLGALRALQMDCLLVQATYPFPALFLHLPSSWPVEEKKRHAVDLPSNALMIQICTVVQSGLMPRRTLFVWQEASVTWKTPLFVASIVFCVAKLTQKVRDAAEGKQNP